MERIIGNLKGRLPARPPAAVLHGDLWAGNLLPLASGGVACIDPASFIGDPVADPAMTTLFGGVPGIFVASWREALGVDTDVACRAAAAQAMHLLNHVCMFGPGYVPQLHSCMEMLR